MLHPSTNSPEILLIEKEVLHKKQAQTGLMHSAPSKLWADERRYKGGALLESRSSDVLLFYVFSIGNTSTLNRVEEKKIIAVFYSGNVLFFVQLRL